MPRASTIDRMPEEIRAEIKRLLGQGATLDEILDHLRALHGVAPSRSALGRHALKAGVMGEYLKRTRAVAEILHNEFGDEAESKLARTNVEMLHSIFMDALAKAAEAGDGDAEARLEVFMKMAKAIDHLGSASKRNIEFVAQVEKRTEAKAKKEAAVAVDRVAREQGISPATLAAIKAGIFGVAA